MALSSQPTPLAAPPHRRRDPAATKSTDEGATAVPATVVDPDGIQGRILLLTDRNGYYSPSMPTARAMCGIRRAAV